MKNTQITMNELDRLESQSIYILREAYHQFKHIGMLWSIGKDSTVMLYLARRAFFGHMPIPLIHIDTSYKIPEMIAYRNALACELKLTLIVGQNEKAIQEKQTYPDGAVDRLTCCGALKAQALNDTLTGKTRRYRLNHQTKVLEVDTNTEPYTGIIAGIRGDEEGSRSKERYFSPRGKGNQWDLSEQPPEFWNQYNSDCVPGTHIRIHPLLDWTELNIWKYIEREKIKTVSLYFNHGNGKRYRSIGCYPCTSPIESEASTVQEIVEELETGALANISERSGRAQDKEGGGTLEALRRKGYM